jgi:hypothetical protein
MNRELIVMLLQKNIEELHMITDGFMEMTEYPKPIILLAQRKTEDIQEYIKQLSEITPGQQPVAITSTGEAINTERTELIEDSKQEITNKGEFYSVVEFEPTINPDPVEDFKIENPLVEVEKKHEHASPEIDASVESTMTAGYDPTELTSMKEAINAATTRNESLSRNENTLGDTLGNKKISDIKQAISISDRFRFQRELFKGNGEEMNKTLSYINQLATYDEVESFLQSKYNWPTENESQNEFYQIVKRRFL